MKTTVVQPHKSKIGMDANTAVMLMYLIMVVMTFISWIPFIGGLGNLLWAVLPVIILIIDRDSEFLKYQSAQALIIGILRAAIDFILAIPRIILDVFFGGGIIALLLWFISVVISLIITAATVYILLAAYQYKQVELPVLSPIVDKVNAALDKMFWKK